MTQEEKQLLLKDLCARFIYGVIVRVYDIEHGDFDSYVDNISNTCIETRPVEELTIDFNPYVFYKLQEIKPYLRPMSSMTEEEIKEYEHLIAFSGSSYGAANLVDWLNKKMFAYRNIDGKNMFELGLALKAPKGMYK